MLFVLWRSQQLITLVAAARALPVQVLGNGVGLPGGAGAPVVATDLLAVKQLS